MNLKAEQAERPVISDSKKSVEKCQARRPGHSETCVRHCGHRGVHLSDQGEKLVYWV